MNLIFMYVFLLILFVFIVIKDFRMVLRDVEVVCIIRLLVVDVILLKKLSFFELCFICFGFRE